MISFVPVLSSELSVSVNENLNRKKFKQARDKAMVILMRLYQNQIC